MIAISNSGIGE